MWRRRQANTGLGVSTLDNFDLCCELNKGINNNDDIDVFSFFGLMGYDKANNVE